LEQIGVSMGALCDLVPTPEPEELATSAFDCLLISTYLFTFAFFNIALHSPSAHLIHIQQPHFSCEEFSFVFSRHFIYFTLGRAKKEPADGSNL